MVAVVVAVVVGVAVGVVVGVVVAVGVGVVVVVGVAVVGGVVVAVGMTKKQFRALRIKSGLTQAELAKAMGVCRRTITAIETGDREVTFKDRVAIEYIASQRFE